LGSKATVAIVSVDEDLDALKKILRQGIPGHCGARREPQGPSSFGTSKFPESFLLDPSGKVRYAFINKRDWSVPEAAACVEGLM
jgi:hypothetical protein